MIDLIRQLFIPIFKSTDVDNRKTTNKKKCMVNFISVYPNDMIRDFSVRNKGNISKIT